MKIPVVGFVTDSGDGDAVHSHKLHITSCGGVPVHVNGFCGVTSINDGHAHEYASWTAPAATGVPHVHVYQTITSLDHGHTHHIRGTTGPAIDLPCGGHYHLFEGCTTVDGVHPHSHNYSGQTGDEVFD